MGKKDKGGTGENIRVCIRVRPLSNTEINLGCKEAVQVDLVRSVILVHHAVGDPTGPFSFDAVYNNSFKQQDIFIQEVYPMVESVLQGYNATVFAYGQSGSGKTYTMTGSPGGEHAGVMPNAIAHIFDSISKLASPSKQFQVKVSHVELYNGKARDLLSESSANLEIKQNMAKNFYVKGLLEESVSSLDQTLRLFESSQDRRRTATTDLNEHSSRSHSIFSISVESLDFETDPSSPQHMVSKLNLVDLAGSERQSKTGAAGDTLKEGCNINLSLSALGTVIDTIVKGSPHIPYRSSPLTMLLKDSLGGNSKTVMFANVGPADRNISETISTLRFADRAKQITNKPVRNLDPKDLRIQELQAEVERLQKKIGKGGAADDEEMEVLRVKVEELEVELNNAYASMEKDKLALEEVSNILRKELGDCELKLKHEEQERAALAEEKQMLAQTQASEEEHATELKRLVVNFVKGALPAPELRRIQEAKGVAGTDLGDPKTLRPQQIMAVLDGLREHFMTLKKNAITSGDLEKFLTGQAAEFEKKFASYRAQQEAERTQLSDAKAALERKLETSSQEMAEAKVKLSQMQQELEKADKKAEKALRKMKEKLQEAMKEHQAQAEQAEKQGGELRAQHLREVQALQQQLRDLQRREKALIEEAEREQEAVRVQLEETQAKLEGELKNRDATLHRSNSRIHELESLLETKEKGATQQNGQRMDGAELVLLQPLQTALQVHYQLGQLRHQQNAHLADLLQQHSTLAAEAAQREQARQAEAVAQWKAALESKEKEMDTLREKHQKEQEKLVKKVNKKLQEVAQRTAQVEEERITLEEEKHDLLATTEELSKANEQLELELHGLKIRHADQAAAFEDAEKAKKNDFAALRQELEAVQQELAAAQKVISGEFEEVKDDRLRLKETVARLEASLEEKMVTLENNRQTMKRTAVVLEREKQKLEVLNKELEEERRRFKDMEAYWKDQLEDNTKKLLAVNNKKMQEQVLVHQLAIQEEHREQAQLKDRVRKLKNSVQKEKQKYDELVLEYDQFRRQFEEFKVTSMRMYRDKEELEIEDSASSIKAMLKSQAQERQAKQMQFGMGFATKR